MFYFHNFSASRPIPVSIKHINGKTVSLSSLSLSSSIAEVKKLFQEIEGVPPDHQCLVINGKIAEDLRTLDYYGRYCPESSFLKGNQYIFRGGNSLEIVLLPF